MGAAASATATRSALIADEVAARVRSLGTAFEPVARRVAESGVDERTVLSYKGDTETLIGLLGVDGALERRRLGLELAELFEDAAAAAAAAAAPIDTDDQVDALKGTAGGDCAGSKEDAGVPLQVQFDDVLTDGLFCFVTRWWSDLTTTQSRNATTRRRASSSRRTLRRLRS
jgi:hypothetical protein